MENHSSGNSIFPCWLRSFRSSRRSTSGAKCLPLPENKGFARSYRRSLDPKHGVPSEQSKDGNNPTRASLMSIRQIWAVEATKASLGGKVPERKSKKPCAKVQSSPSRIPISPHMKAQLKVQSLQSHDKENTLPRNCETLSTSGESLGSAQSSEIVLRAAKLAKSRRSSCGCRLDFERARDAKFQKAANCVGLPRTSTETGFTKSGQGECNVRPLADVSCIGGSTKIPGAGKMVLNPLETSSTVAWQSEVQPKMQPRLQRDSVPERNVHEAVRVSHWGSSHVISLAPAIPPKTYLAKMAHAKAHLTKTAMPDLPRGYSLCGMAQSERQGRPASKEVKTARNIPLLPWPATGSSNLKCKGNIGKPKIQLPEGRVPGSNIAASTVPLSMSFRMENNPSYGLMRPTRTSQYSKADTGMVADDEITILNCSCQRCLTKFSSSGQQEWQKKRSSNRNLSYRNMRKPQTQLPPPRGASECPKAAVEDHCTCCNCRRRKSAAGGQPVKAALQLQSKAKVTEFPRGKEKEPSTAEANILEGHDDITRIVELAVKASLEKILSLNSFGFLGKKCRSLEDFSVPNRRKVMSPAKYILLSACTSGKPVAEGSDAKTESGLGISQRSCSVDDLPSAGDMGDVSHDLYNTFLELRSQRRRNDENVDHERTMTPERPDLPASSTEAQPLVDGGAYFESTKISTAFIRLIKTEASSESGKEGDTEWPVTGNNKASVPGIVTTGHGAAQSLYSGVEVPEATSGPKTCTKLGQASPSSKSRGVDGNLIDEPISVQSCTQDLFVESAATVACDSKQSRSSAQTEAVEEFLEARNMFSRGSQDEVPSDSRAEASLGRRKILSSNVSSLVLPSECCTSSTSSLPSRKSPDGWERTPTTDASVLCILEDEASELNLGGLNGELCSGNSSTDDDKILEEVILKGMGVTPHTKLPLRYPKSPSKSARRFKPGEYFSGKAKLKMAAYTNSSHVTVHVIRAVKLVTSRGHSANSYVKVSLQPDPTRQTLWRTAVIKSCRNPEYDHKFSFEPMPEDSEKRLLITVWHRDLQNKHSELLGSMSFSMAKILGSAQYARGWYRLLKQDLGARKHFAARLQKGRIP